MRVFLSLLALCIWFTACGKSSNGIQVSPNNANGAGNGNLPVTSTDTSLFFTPAPSPTTVATGGTPAGGGVIVIPTFAPTPTPDTEIVPIAPPTCTISTSRYCGGAYGACHSNPSYLYRGGWARFVLTVNGVTSGLPVWNPSPASGATGNDVSHYWTANGSYRMSATISGPGGSYTCHSQFFTVVAPPGSP